MSVTLGRGGTLSIPDAVSYWPLNEASGTRADAVGSNDLTDNATVTQAEGVQGRRTYAGQFVTANSEFLDIADGSQTGLDITGDMTVIAWIRLDSLPSAGSAMSIASKYATNELSWDLLVNTSDYVTANVSSNGTTLGATLSASTFGALSVDTWYFVAFRHTNGVGIDVRVNATDQAQGAFVGSINSGAADVNVGAFNDGAGQYFDGRIAHVGIFNRVLSDSELLYLYGLRGKLQSLEPYANTVTLGSSGVRGLSPVSYWSLGEASGTRADSAGLNPLTDNATVTQAQGIRGKAAQFTVANSEYLNITDAAQTGLDITGHLTVAAWIYLDSVPSAGAQMDIVARWTAGGNRRSYLFYVFTDDELTFTVDSDGIGGGSGTVQATGFGALSANTWYFVYGKYDGTNVYAGVNTTETSAAYSSGIFGGTSNFAIGSDSTGAVEFFDGRIDEVGIWKRALLADEITYLYNTGRGRGY